MSRQWSVVSQQQVTGASSRNLPLWSVFRQSNTLRIQETDGLAWQ